jgi:hypothetical protein
MGLRSRCEHGVTLSLERCVHTLAFASLTGCFPVGLPPVELRGGAATVLGGAQAADPDGVLGETTGFRAGTVRGTIAPLAAFDALNARPFDAGVGYLAELDTESDRTFRTHGPHLSATYFPLVQELGGSARSNPPWGKEGPNPNPLLRLGLSASGELLMSEDGGNLELGGGTTASLVLDLTMFAHGPAVTTPSESGFFIGGVHGETGIGIFVSGSYRNLHGGDYGVVGGGLSLRLPALGGLLFFVPN